MIYGLSELGSLGGSLDSFVSEQLQQSLSFPYCVVFFISLPRQMLAQVTLSAS